MLDDMILETFEMGYIPTATDIRNVAELWFRGSKDYGNPLVAGRTATRPGHMDVTGHFACAGTAYVLTEEDALRAVISGVRLVYDGSTARAVLDWNRVVSAAARLAKDWHAARYVRFVDDVRRDGRVEWDAGDRVLYIHNADSYVSVRFINPDWYMDRGII